MMPMAAPALQGTQFGAQQTAVFPNQYTAPQPQLQTAPTMPQLQTAPTMGGYAPQQPHQRPYSPMVRTFFLFLFA
jgi:hypothetical protein